jgi:hypothetical protein
MSAPRSRRCFCPRINGTRCGRPPPLLLSVTRPLPSEGAEPRAGSHIDVCVDAAWVIPYKNERNKKCLFGDGL